MFDYLCQYVFTLALIQRTPHEKFNRQESSCGWIICISESIKYWREDSAVSVSGWKNTVCLVSRSSTRGCCWNQNRETQRELHVLPCPSFFIVSKFAKDLLNQLKSILTGLNTDTEATLQYDVLGRAMCYI